MKLKYFIKLQIISIIYNYIIVYSNNLDTYSRCEEQNNILDCIFIEKFYEKDIILSMKLSMKIQ